MNHIALYEEWMQYDSSDLSFSTFKNLRNLHKDINGVWSKTGKPWLNTLSENVMSLFSMEDFIGAVAPNLNESVDYKSKIELYAVYEVSLLKTHRPDWFLNEDKILTLPNYAENKMVLCKNGSMFIISMSTWKVINEGIFSDFVDKAKEMAGNAWDSLASGAQEVFTFVSKIASSVATYTANNPLEVAAMTLTILSGISAFIPVVGQIVAPILTTLAGGVEVYAGYSKFSKGLGYLKKIDNPIAKTIAAAKEGVPYLIAGGVTLILGVNGMVTGIKDAAPGVGLVNKKVNQLLETAADDLAKNIVVKLEHSVSHAVEGLLAKVGKESLAHVHQLTHAGGAFLMILLVKAGKGLFGKVFDALVAGISALGSAFEFLLGIPKKIEELITSLDKKAESSAAKLIAGALNKVVKPIVSGMSNFIDKYIKPIVEPITNDMKLLGENYKVCVEMLEQHVKDIPDKVVEIKHDQIKDRGDVKISSENKETIEKLQKSEGKGEDKKEGGSGGDIEKTLKSLDPNFKGIKGNPKKLTVEFEGWGDKKIDAKKQEMSMDEFVKNMKSKDWKKIRFQYDGKYPTDLHKGGAYVRLKAVNESSILFFNEWVKN
jgi:hypothetical protein